MAVQYGSGLDARASHLILPIAQLLVKMQTAYGHIVEEQPRRRPHQTILLLHHIELLSITATVKFIAAVCLLMIHFMLYCLLIFI